VILPLISAMKPRSLRCLSSSGDECISLSTSLEPHLNEFHSG
jgi:hypothetical protein